jgi:hypothetical protein
VALNDVSQVGLIDPKSDSSMCSAALSSAPPSTDGSTQGAQAPRITHAETYLEGVLVYVRVLFADPDGDAEGFGFRGVNGAGWAEESHPFSNPSYGRISPGMVDYPFNHACGTNQEIQSDVEVWIYDAEGARSQPVTVHMTCAT